MRNGIQDLRIDITEDVGKGGRGAGRLLEGMVVVKGVFGFCLLLREKQEEIE